MNYYIIENIFILYDFFTYNYTSIQSGLTIITLHIYIFLTQNNIQSILITILLTLISYSYDSTLFNNNNLINVTLKTSGNDKQKHKSNYLRFFFMLINE